MASLTEVFAIESDRATSDKWNKIHLFKMGDFWRAYEWSAWLVSVITFNDEVRMATKDRKPLHVTRMERTDIEGTYCFVGFPVRSLEKFIPTRENFESIDDKHVVVTITLPQPTDGSELSEDYIKGSTFSGVRENYEVPHNVPEGKVFVLGDNRGESLDSRYEEIGLIDEKDIIAKVDHIDRQ